MIVRRVRVRHWRRYREWHEFEFGEGINLLVGPNEAGKSTLFEVMQRTLFDRHTGAAQELRAVRPHESDLDPEAEVELETGAGERVRMRKRFLGKQTAEFSKLVGEEWRLEADGDEAEKRIREMFDASLPGRGVTKPEHRGLGQALWYLQGESLPDGQWDDSVRDKLREATGEMQLAVGTPREDRIVSRIKQERDRYWTKTGRLTKNCELWELKNERLPELKDEIQHLQETLETVAEDRRALERYEEQRRRKRAALQEADERIDELEEQLEGYDEKLERADELERHLDNKQNEVEGYREDRETLVELNERGDELGEAIEQQEKRRARLEAETGRLEDEIDALEQRRSEELRPEIKRVSSHVEALTAEERRRELQDQLESVESSLNQRGEIEEAIEQLNAELSELDAPSADELQSFRDNLRELEQTRAAAEASAIRVEFDLEGIEVSTRPEVASDGDQVYSVVRPTTFQLGEHGEFEVRGGGRDLEELNQEIEKLEEEVKRTLQRYDVEDEEQLQERRVAAEDLERRLEQARERLGGVESADDLKEKQRHLRGKIEDQASRRGERASEVEEMTDEELSEQMQAKRKRRDELEAEIEALEEKLQAMRAERSDVAGTASDVNSELAECRAERKQIRSRREEILDNYGTRDRLEEVIEVAEDEVTSLEGDLDELRELREQEVEPLRDELAQQREERERLEAQIDEVEEKIQRCDAEIRALTGEGARQKLDDLEAERQRVEERIERLETRAEGAKMLWQLVEGYQEKRSQVLAGPVREMVDGWMRRMTDERHTELQLDEALSPAGVAMATYEQPLAFGELSFGTKEQAAVLLRLALGVLLSEQERQTVILDDKLINSDPGRHRALNRILSEVAEECQLLIATCDDTPYSGVQGRRIEVPGDGRG